MTLTATTTTLAKTSAELLAILKSMTAGQQNVIRCGHDAYVNRRRVFFLKWPSTKVDAQALGPDYVTEVDPGQYQLTELGVNLYRAWLHQPIVPKDAGSKPTGYHGTRHSRNYHLREMWEQKLPANGLPALTKSEATPPKAVETAEAPTLADEPGLESTEDAEKYHTPVPSTSPQPPAPTPAVVQLDLTALVQPLLAKIDALEAQLATMSKPAPQPVTRRKSHAAMPMSIQPRRRTGGAA